MLKIINLCLLSVIVHASLKSKVFEFEKSPTLSSSGFSVATLENRPSLPSKFVLCSSHFQREVNTKSTRTIYVIYEDDQFLIPWFNIGIWSENFLWANIENSYWYALAKVTEEDFADWIHICLDIDTEQKEIITSINRKSYNKTLLREFQKVPKFYLKIGKVHHSEYNIPSQFYGMVSNIQLLTPDAETALCDLTKDLCRERKELSILYWSDMSWNISGKDVRVMEQDSSFTCSDSSNIDLYVPFKITRRR